MPRFSVAVELRLGLIEMVLTAIWVFFTAAAVPAVLWPCLDSCGDNRRQLAIGMPCPPPTVAIQVALATGFIAAAVTSLSFSKNEMGSMAGGGMGEESTGFAVDRATHSGAAWNPAVTLALALRGHITPHRCCSFLTGQLAGAVLGAALLLGVIGQPCYDDALAQADSSCVGPGGVVLLNTICTVLLVLVHLWSSKRLGFMAAPIIVGFAYIGCVLVAYPITSESNLFNPLRGFGIAAVSSDGKVLWDRQWEAWVGALVGGIVAAGLDVLFFNDRLWHGAERSLQLPAARAAESGQPATPASTSTAALEVERA